MVKLIFYCLFVYDERIEAIMETFVQDNRYNFSTEEHEK